MVKKAVLIGVNYPGTKGELWGCINDVGMTYEYLVEEFEFQEENITLLIDTYEQFDIQPTGKNIRAALNGLVDLANPGDVLFVHFSGHGTRFPAETGQDDDTGFDECIVPCDNNYIFDSEIRELVSQVPEGCTFTFVSDSCHSGGRLIESAKEQIGESFKKKPRGSISEKEDGENKVNGRNKFLPLEAAINMLKQKTGRDNIKLGNIRMTLFDVFGEDASPQVKKFMKVIYSNLLEKHDEGSLSGHSNGEEVHTEHYREDLRVEHNTSEEHYNYSESFQMTRGIEEDSISEHSTDEDITLEHMEELETEFLEEKLNDEEYWKPVMGLQVKNKKEVYAGAGNGGLVDNGILLSGCQSDQTCTDVGVKREESYGAFTKTIQTILVVTEGNISYSDLVSKARKLLEKNGYRQRPGLYCTDSYVDDKFIC